jgi:hypothetical protein
MIIDVECEDGTTQIARTVLENQDSYIVNFLEKNKESFYHFIDEDEEVSKESVSGFYDVETLEETDLFANFHKDMSFSMIVKTRILNVQLLTKMIQMMIFLSLMKKKPKLKNTYFKYIKWTIKSRKNA